ncbi:PQQ-binding-like beta-propeller repeat protein [Sulfurisphaera ohwakuensis]|uniref:outer membrane protein assembly factor BamB family protein n=1 Tax=Sulfurisphaera ohwakuensis TaxID=69656 RepID=UPI0036F2E1E1
MDAKILGVILLIVGLIIGIGVGYVIHQPVTTTKIEYKTVTPSSMINETTTTLTMKSPLTGVSEEVTETTYQNSTMKWYQYVYYNYGNCYLPWWTTVTYYPSNLPKDPINEGNWTVYAYQQDHESVININFPAENWSFEQMNALPLNAPFPAYKALGNRTAPVILTQLVGDAVGVTYFDGIIYVPSDANELYAINAYTGKLIWEATTANSVMSNPIVVNTSRGPIVYVSVGDAGFSASHSIFAVITGNYKNVVRGYSYGAVYAFNATNGQLLWVHFDDGNVMPTPAYIDGLLIYGDGSGHIVALNATTGQVVWRDYVGVSAFDSMSSTNYYVFPNGTTIAIMGFTLALPPYGELIAVNVQNGQIVWNFSLPKGFTPFNTGMGDVSPAVDEEKGIVVQSTIVNFNKTNRTVGFAVFALNATNGHLLWIEQLVRGYVPPAFKGGVPTIYNGVVYVGTPVANELFALNETNGKILWVAQIPSVQGPPNGAGGGRANPVYVNGYIIEPAGAYIDVYNASNGQLIKSYYVGGRFGIVNAVVVGSTVFVDNSYNWVFAIPLNELIS